MSCEAQPAQPSPVVSVSQVRTHDGMLAGCPPLPPLVPRALGVRMSEDRRAGQARSPFCRPHDPPDLKTVVQGTLCHITPEALDALCAPLPGPHAPVSGSRQPTVARRALQARAVAARGGVRLCDGAPSTVDIMHLPGWALLLERIGKAARL